MIQMLAGKKLDPIQNSEQGYLYVDFAHQSRFFISPSCKYCFFKKSSRILTFSRCEAGMRDRELREELEANLSIDKLNKFQGGH